jgi:hypothetical protein
MAHGPKPESPGRHDEIRFAPTRIVFTKDGESLKQLDEQA